MPLLRKTSSGLPYVFEWTLIAVALVLAYSPALNGTLLWDDPGHITRQDLRSLAGLWRIWTELGATQQYYPVLHSAFWLEHRWWGDALLGYHLANVVLHSLSAMLLILILRRLAVPGALLAGFIFALHPVMVESVAWMSEQKNTLSGFFYLASAYGYLQFDEDRRRWRYVAASLLFACAMASKSVTATLPAVLLVMVWWRRGRLGWSRDVVPLLTWFAAAIGAGLVTAWFEYHAIGARGADFSLTFLERCLIAGRIFWFYLAKLVWPADLMFIYPHWTVDARDWRQYLPSAAALASGFACLALARRTRAPLAAWLFFVGTLVPVLGFLNVYPFRFSYVADHFQYLASLGFIVPIAACAAVLSERYASRTITRRTAIAVLIVLATLTWRQSRIYTDAETLWRQTAIRNPDSWLAYLNLGTELAARRRFQEAIDAFANAVRLKPDHEPARRDLALAHLMFAAELGDSAANANEAARHLGEALRLDPSNERAHLNLGNLFLQMPGRVDEAIAEYQAALRIKPDYFRAHYNLGTVLLDIPERRFEAISHLEAAVWLEPSSPEAHVNLAIALSDTPESLPEAIKHLETALALRPDLAQARELLRQLRGG